MIFNETVQWKLKLLPIIDGDLCRKFNLANTEKVEK